MCPFYIMRRFSAVASFFDLVRLCIKIACLCQRRVAVPKHRVGLHGAFSFVTRDIAHPFLSPQTAGSACAHKVECNRCLLFYLSHDITMKYGYRSISFLCRRHTKNQQIILTLTQTWSMIISARKKLHGFMQVKLYHRHGRIPS